MRGARLVSDVVPAVLTGKAVKYGWARTFARSDNARCHRAALQEGFAISRRSSSSSPGHFACLSGGAHFGSPSPNCHPIFILRQRFMVWMILLSLAACQAAPDCKGAAADTLGSECTEANERVAAHLSFRMHFGAFAPLPCRGFSPLFLSFPRENGA